MAEKTKQQIIEEALALREKVLAQREKQQNKFKLYREIAQIVLTKYHELGKQKGGEIDWVKSIISKL